MGRLSDPQDDREYPRYVSDADDGLDQLPNTAWQAEHERIRTLDRFPRLGVQDVPPPPVEQKSFNAVLLLGTVVLVAAVSSYAAVTLLPRWSGLAFTYSRADASVTQHPAASPPVAPPAFVPSVTSANAAPAIAPAQGTAPAANMPLREDGLPKAEMRTANINPTAAAPRTPSTVQGVTDSEIRLGMAAPFGGPSREMGRQLKLGIETAFNQANDNGGVYGRQLKLVTADDGYEPTRTLDAMKELYEKDKVFGFVENYGSPTALVSVPYALERHALYFGAFTGAPSLRHDPPDRYVFNFRAGYAEEANALIHYLVKVRRLRPEEIGVLTQQDAYGDAGWDGVTKAVRALRGGDSANILRMTYPRNTVDVDAAVAQLRRQRPVIKAVVLVATVRPAAKFIEKTRDLYPDMIYTTISGVGSTGLANELMLLGPRFADGVVCTQVTPPVDSYASVALNYKKALAKYFPGEPADYMSLEAYLTANILIEGLRRVGPTFDTEALVDTLEGMRNYELGLGPKIAFDPSDHQAVHKVWGTQLDKSGQYHAVDLE
ncbi:putative branched-chain amino acid ABC transporter [Bradyrhizobium sp. STM 3843]|uniref:ABC transporter substrate-binding protein n=1 Tax=Bradyrhizobium sp. STM 3843 TaxID=551947 RepID=UPI00024040D5|nr:ABC transporter substrate-binding protein [Bradyrhizobium sp. STM 3843]CCE12225.1 putative branched-chain amino acid ABC transporter [Bradyrhizobium sp. STM 3843]